LKQGHLESEKYKSNHIKQSTKERKKKEEEEVNILQHFSGSGRGLWVLDGVGSG